MQGCDLPDHGVHDDLTDLLDAGIVEKSVYAKIAAENSENICYQQSDSGLRPPCPRESHTLAPSGPRLLSGTL